jgi:perosamine synthetase
VGEVRLRLHPRHRIDLGGADALYALAASGSARDRERLAARALAAWGDVPRDEALVSLSVRSAFDLLLSALALPRGAEVLLSAITHPEIPRIVRRHGLQPVPVDLDPDTLAPAASALERAAGPDTRLVVVAHLFGGRADLAPASALAVEGGLPLVEDCAQSFSGPGDCGDGLADVSLFSFGPIKTATALGGALVRVRDPLVHDRMAALEEAWPVQARRAYASRALKFLGLGLLAEPAVFGAVYRGSLALGVDLDAALVRMVRGFVPPEGGDGAEREFAERFRRRPSAPLLALLARRLEAFDHDRLARRAELGERVRASLPEQFAFPGRDALERTHWVVPVVAPDPVELVARLRTEGFDASRATSSISVVPALPGRPELDPRAARDLLEHAVFLPVYPELAEAELDRLLAVLHALARRRETAPAPTVRTAAGTVE